ncbi:hypothetical protein [Streptomyces sp. NBC_01198]|uniref:hypothetical protein n=1 Tax=Streptomyces sp. NBC_01198 TaxID=2903769 RepID=UPI002E1579E2|nr:hypothetical protein OG702_03085 [Streptomyces sp. NBC_01198]
MERFGEFYSRHLWLQFATGWLVAAAMVLTLYPGHSVLGTLVRVGGSSAAGVWLTLRRRHREERTAGGADDLLRFDRMLRKGEAPSDPQERQAMGELVDRRLHSTRHRTAALVFLVILFGSVTAMAASMSGLWRAIAYGALNVGFLVYVYFVGRLGVMRLRRMRRLLDDPSPATEAEPAADRSRHFAA